MMKLFTMVAMLALAQTALAGTPKPDHCPSPDAIRAAGLSQSYAEHDSSGWMLYNDYQHLDTTEKWGFVIGNIAAETGVEAYTKAVKGLESLRPIGEPKELMGVWMCSYVSAENYVASAFTEPQQPGQSVGAMRHYFLSR